MHSTRFNKAIFLSLCFLMLLPLSSSVIRAYFHCLNPNDFSIYQQAIYDISAGVSWNPYLSQRAIAIFNDHMDPIIFLAAAFIKIVGPSVYALLVFEWFAFVGLFALFFKMKEFRSLFDPAFLFGAFLIACNRGILRAIDFPIHPTTWLIIPFFLLGYYLHRKNFLGVAVVLAISLLFKETVGALVVGISFYYLINREYRRFILLLALGVSALSFNLFVRPQVLGPVVNYSGAMIASLKSEHIFFIFRSLMNFDPDMKTIFPPLLLLGLSFHDVRSWRDFIRHPSTAIIFLLLPLILIHSLAGRLYHHAYSVFTVPMLSAFLFSTAFAYFAKKKFWLSGIVLLMVVTSMSRYTRMFSYAFNLDKKSCYYVEGKIKSYNKLKNLVKVSHGESLVTTGGLVAHLMKPAMNIYQFSSDSKKLEIAEHLVIEKKDALTTYPFNLEGHLEVLHKCPPMLAKFEPET